MSEKKSLKKNYIYNLSYQILVIIAPIITTPYLSRVLNADGIGVVSFAESIVSYFILFAALGVGTYGQREVSYYQDDKTKRSEVFWNTFIFKAITSSIVLIVYLILYKILFKTNIYLILSVNIIAVFIDITWFFQGLEEFGKIVFRNFIFKLLNIFFIFTFIKTKNDINLYAFSIGFFTFISNFSMWIYLKDYIDKPEIEKIHPFKDLVVIIALFIPTIAIQIYTVLDKSMIGLITKSDFENGYYELGVKISKVLLTVITSLGVAIIPRVGLLFNKKETENIKMLIYKSYRFVWFLGIPLCFGLMILSDNLVPWFLGVGYDKVIILLKILSMLIILIGMSNVTGMQYLIPTKKENLFTLSVCIGAIVNFTLNIIMIQKFLSIGAAISSVIAEFFVTASQIYMARSEISYKQILKEGINYYISGIVMIIVLLFIKRGLTPSLYNSIIIIISGAVSYFATLFILKDKFIFEDLFQMYKGTVSFISKK